MYIDNETRDLLLNLMREQLELCIDDIAERLVDTLLDNLEVVDCA